MASKATFVCVLFFLVLSRPAIGKHLKAVSHYSYFPGNPTPRWPVGKTHLTYAFGSKFTDPYVPPVVSAFDEWASGSGYFTFSRVADIGTSDLKITFQKMNHGDTRDFDGPNGILAHAFSPTDGRLHFDADETWSVGPGPVPNVTDFKSVALHEIGHLLGLSHSEVPNAVMYESFSRGTVKDKLTSDDIQGINALYGGVHSAVFTIRNNCPYSIAPATLTGGGAAASTTGFQLAPGASNNINIPTPWTGRVWARFECSNNGGRFQCNSGDCGSGQVACNGAGAKPPATLAEFTIGGSGGKDFYDVSLVEGFNLAVSIVPNGGCATADCPVDINARCPSQFALRNGAGATIGCRSACEQFGTPQYCCTGANNTPSTCPPTDYSRFFKNLCPKAYSYAFDDPTSTFTCNTGANYVITFCP